MKPIFSLLSSLEAECVGSAHCCQGTELYEISGFCHSVFEVLTLLGSYAVYLVVLDS
jgi:hypothetical protein